MGHLALRIVRLVLARFSLPFSLNNIVRPCSACFSSKSKQLLFSSSCTQINFPLELIYTDVWDPSPICSKSGSKYYVSFLDAYSRYTWLYPMTNKSDVLSIFIKWQKYVEQYFNKKIKMVQFDWGVEYRSLHKCLQNCGIIHRVSYPHTHQQNGVVERKHRHVVETSIALLYHAKIPLQFWDDAFQTACYIINRFPTSTIKNLSPFEKLFNHALDYNMLRVFSCACWPNLRPYNSHKLQPHSSPCIFLGYSLIHKSYKCLHLPSNRVYISGDVLFDETHFLFVDKSDSSLTQLASSSDTVSFQVQPSTGTRSAVQLHVGPPPSPPHSLTPSAQLASSLSPHNLAHPLPDVYTTTQHEPASIHASSPSPPISSSTQQPSASAQIIPATQVQLPVTEASSHPMVTLSKNHITKPK